MDSRRGKRPGARGGRERGREGSGRPGEGKPRPGGRKRKRRRRPGPRSPDGAARVLSEQPKSVDLQREPVEEPLRAWEVATLREHFKFLREHRKDLRLKVNASEDLLLNGVQEPTHRGVCQHLLNKVERGAVLSAAERLAPADAAKLLAGIIRFSADIEYVLLFLEKIQLSSSPAEATAALSQGLERIDFDKVSPAQMRRVLNLLVELFDARERPALLLGMLESRSFRDAFDQAIPDLPESLAHLVLPLRAAQTAVVHGRPNPFASETLRDGVHLLMDFSDRILLRQPPAVRQRLFRFGLQACSAPEHRLHRGLRLLLNSFADSKRKTGQGLSLARHLLAAGEPAAARQLLGELAGEANASPVPAQWLRLLDDEWLERVALLDEPAAATDALGQHTRRAGVCLDTMRPLWIQLADPDQVQTHETTAELLRELCLPGVAPLLRSGRAPTGEPWFAVARSGPPLDSVLARGLELREAPRVALEGVQILAALAAEGVRLPDARAERFLREPNGALLLADLAGAERTDPAAAAAAHLELARDLCRHVLDQARSYIAPAELLAAIPAARSCAELSRAFATALERHAEQGA